MERERRTLAAEVHDGLAQYLAVARRELALPEPDPSGCARRSRPPTGSSARGCRRSRPTRPPTCARRSRPPRGAPASPCASAGSGEAGPEAVTLAARVVSEALANADAHAHASAVEIELRRHRRARSTLTVTDDGCGFDPAGAPGVEDGHLGLTVMRERARGYGGECDSRRPRPAPERGDAVDSALDTDDRRRAPARTWRCSSAAARRCAPTLASFYALGAKRNGWLFHRTLAGTPTPTARS